MSFDLYLDDSTVKALTDAADRNLVTPCFEENATFKPGKEAGLGTWSELYVIRESALVPPKDGKQDGSVLVFKLALDVVGTAEGGVSDKNAGRTHYLNLYIDKADLFDKSSKFYAMTARRIGTVNSLLNALGVPTEGGVKYGEWFNGEDKPLVGQKVVGTTRKYKYFNKKSEEHVISVDIDGFAPVA